MTTKRSTRTIGPLIRAVTAPTSADPTDADLLRRFIGTRDERAFATLVRRHAPMVLGVCRRVLPNEPDAEDAFQATFLILALKATTVTPAEMVGNWLYGVARTTALQARRANRRRARHECQVTVLPEPESTPRAGHWDAVLPILDRELSQLPDRYRVVLVLCDLGGTTRQEAARQLSVPEGTINSRLARARIMLADRLTRRGVALPGGMLAAVFAQNASASVSGAATASTIRVAALVTETGPATTGVSAGVALLTKGVMRTMFVTKLKAALAVVLVLAGLGFGGAWSFRAFADERQPLPPGPTPAPAKDKAATKPEDNLKNTLLALDKHLWEASAKGDWQERSKFYAEDMVTISVLGKYGKADCVAADKRVRCTDWKISDAEVVPTSKDTAVLCYRYNCKITSNDGAVLETRKDYRVTYVWANRNGGWVIVFCFDDHGRKAPPNPPAWRADLDLDRDGQISLSEWRRAGLSVTEFMVADQNGDGHLSPDEYRRVGRPEPKPTDTKRESRNEKGRP